MVNFERSLIASDDMLQLETTQIQFAAPPFGQSFTSVAGDLGLFPGGPGASAAFGGELGGAVPQFISLQAFSQEGDTDTFFTDPFFLLSGQPDLSLDDFLMATITIALIGGEDTELRIGQMDFFSIALLDAGDPSEVPIPGALVLMLSGLAGLGFAGRRKRTRVKAA